jgi:PhnB protein
MSNPHISIHLNFDGTCAEAFRFYEQALGGKIQMIMTFGQSPMGGQMPDSDKDKVMHASMNIGGFHLMGADANAHYPWPGSAGYAISLSYPTVEEAQKAFDALSPGGQVVMPLQATFWAKAFGMVNDRFKVPWMISCEQPNQAS